MVEHIEPQQRLDGQIILTPYDPVWPDTYQRLSSAIRVALNDIVIEQILTI